MKKLFVLVSALMLMVGMAFAQGTATNTAKPAKTKAPKAAKASKAPKAAVPTDDAGIEKCISDKFSTQEKMKAYGLSVKVSGGVATLTGTVPNGGSKGNATSTAKRCGAKTVANNITVTPKTKAPKTPKAAKAAKATK
ncbi:MAG: hypothetical protein NVSMB56_15570 [Pyrinomonadaceae bacterium]